VPQIIIDPQRLGSQIQAAPFGTVPAAARDFGYIPDLSLCRPGDLILSFSREPGFVERQITKTQTLVGFSNEDARWTHAAVFLYGDYITEAVPEKVSFHEVCIWTFRDVLRVRRSLQLSDDERYKIALCAVRNLGARYDTKVAISAGWKARFGLWDRVWFPLTGRTIVCSKVYYDAHVEITRKLLDGCSIDDLVTPAHLSATRDLVDIAIPWLRVPKTRR
jgi:hypothetical protein